MFLLMFNRKLKLDVFNAFLVLIYGSQDGITYNHGYISKICYQIWFKSKKRGSIKHTTCFEGFLPVGIIFCNYISPGGGCRALPTTFSILSIMFLLVTEEGWVNIPSIRSDISSWKPKNHFCTLCKSFCHMPWVALVGGIGDHPQQNHIVWSVSLGNRRYLRARQKIP